MAKKKAAGPRTVQCYHCGHRFDVSALAMTGSCPKCYGKLMFDDVIVTNTQAYKRLQTCGRLLIEAKGRVIADYVNAIDGVEVIGRLEAKGYEGGPVVIRKKAMWQGDCRAPSLVLEEGAQVRSGYFVIPADPIGEAAEMAEQTPSRTEAMLETDAETLPVMKTSSTRRPRPMAPPPTPAQPQTAPVDDVDSEASKPKIKTSSTRVPRPETRVIPAEPSSVSAQKKKAATKKTAKKAPRKK